MRVEGSGVFEKAWVRLSAYLHTSVGAKFDASTMNTLEVVNESIGKKWRFKWTWGQNKLF